MANPPPAAPVAPVADKPDLMDEPKTLSPAELEALRAEALHIIETHTPEEAAAIFLAGLKDVSENPRPPPKVSKGKKKRAKRACNAK